MPGKKIECIKCRKPMRSDNLKRHKEKCSISDSIRPYIKNNDLAGANSSSIHIANGDDQLPKYATDYITHITSKIKFILADAKQTMTPMHFRYLIATLLELYS